MYQLCCIVVVVFVVVVVFIVVVFVVVVVVVVFHFNCVYSGLFTFITEMSSQGNPSGGVGNKSAEIESTILPSLPPIEKPKVDDPFAGSKLMTFRLERRKKNLLKKIM